MAYSLLYILHLALKNGENRFSSKLATRTIISNLRTGRTATHRSREWICPLHVLAVQCSLQTSPINQPLVHYIHTTVPHSPYMLHGTIQFFPSKILVPSKPWGYLDPYLLHHSVSNKHTQSTIPMALASPSSLLCTKIHNITNRRTDRTTMKLDLYQHAGYGSLKTCAA